ncbi:nucleic acid dioxygenase ALKBH1-like [Oppia nitens]|uniref:nucleic acid dioxygenase ALKBH1-like n=1 Tax=Oppia nitens TaxID=1686743 RepID=UPI0023DB2756|nr:nucleic acid dioxygenase ALKBH1-like [Oppia nitens]
MSDNCLDNQRDCFKPIFKYYKNNEYLKSSNNEIIDFLKVDLETRHEIKEIAINRNNNRFDSPLIQDFRDINNWKMFSIDSVDGLLVVPQILTKEASNKWFHYLLKELPYTECDHLKANISLPPTQDTNLRWISFGYHHNWDTKMYDESNDSPIPIQIQQLFEYISQSLGFNTFNGQSGLINYYNNGSTLCPHSDHSEPNKTAPLFSLSLGSTAIFLIGDTTKWSTKPVVSIYLRDGDLLIMSSQSRQAFHAIPKVFNDSVNYKHEKVKRININIRQMSL